MVVPPGRRSMLVALGQVGLFGAALTAVVIVLLPADVDAPLWSLAVYALVGSTYPAAGLVAWWRRPSGRVGALLCLCGAAFLASAMGNVTVPALAAVGVALGELCARSSGPAGAAIARRPAITEKAVVQHASRIDDLLGLAAGGEDHRRVLAVVRYPSR